MRRGGGGTTLPAEYFGKHSGRDYAAVSPELDVCGGAAKAQYQAAGETPAYLRPCPDASGVQTGGGGTTLPAEYFGKGSGRYYAAGSPELGPFNTAYGQSLATSFGTYGSQSTGPNLAPGPDSSGMQTGGGRRKKRRSKTPRRSRKTTKSRKSYKNRKSHKRN